ncbi:Gmad2 immunoglobulin-like domain-containing protein [Candidatus Nomurabacteria bacterium]|nr:Gmad2 immunoglobulin-like domain-containing protein [Candidatus Nomurabacteria bacterium]
MKSAIMVTLVLFIFLVLFFCTLLWPHKSEAPTTPIADTSAETPTDTSLIHVFTPQPQAAVSSPVSLSGEARGYWFFEASAPVVVVDWDGRIIGEGYVTAEGEWMTEDFVPFSGTIDYTLPVDSYSASGTIIFHKDNPSGLPEHDAAFEVPVLLN